MHYQEEAYREDYVSEFCNWDALCGGSYYDDLTSCEQAFDENWDRLVEGCTFVPRDARLCVKGLRSLECPAEGEDADWPRPCDEDYVDCP
jgi:hypothetical protein